MDTATLFWLSFLAGIYAPIGSPCVLVLYPGYISFLAGRSEANRIGFAPFTLGIAVAAGVIISMLIGGLLFTGILQIIGDEARIIITAALFVILLIFSLFLLFDIDYERYTNPIPAPRLGKPLPAAFLLGLTFGAIILPCNAASIAVLLALAASASGFLEGLGAFLCFGLGITLPLILIATLSQAQNRQVIDFLKSNRRAIRVISGLFMLVISLWYLVLLLFPVLFP
jgi:cytochrome c-type biogenesis protein